MEVPIDRMEYLLMLDRHWPLASAIDEFVILNGIRSIVEAGCGIGRLCYYVDSYTGIDLNQTVLTDNELFYRRGKWLCGDWLEMNGLEGELFVATSLVEHCESFQVCLKKVLSLPCRYAVVSFHKGLRDKERIQQHPTGPFFENYYSRTDVEEWLSAQFRFGSVRWCIYDLPLSRRKRQAIRESVLVIDRTGKAKLGMWERRAL